MLFIPRFWYICIFFFFHTLTNAGELMISVDNLLIRAFPFNTVGVYGLFLVSSNCLVLLIFFYWFPFFHCVSQRQRRANSNHEIWMRCLINLWAFEYLEHLIYVIGKNSLEALQGVEGREEGQFALRLVNCRLPSAGMVPALTPQDPALNWRCWDF